MSKRHEEVSPFDAVNFLLRDDAPNQKKNVGKVAPSPQPGGRYEVFRMYDALDNLLYISRSAQLHKLKDREFWPSVATIKVTRHPDPGAAENDKVVGISNEKPKWNVMNAGI